MYFYSVSPFSSRNTCSVLTFSVSNSFSVPFSMLLMLFLALATVQNAGDKTQFNVYDCEGRSMKFTISKNALKLNHITEYRPFGERKKMVMLLVNTTKGKKRV